MFERTAVFEDYLEAARHYPQLWRIICGTLAAFTVRFGVMAVVGAGMQLWFDTSLFDPDGSQSGLFSPPLLVLFFLFLFAFVALGATVGAAFHHRSFMSMMSPVGFVIRDFILAIRITLPILLLAFVVGFVATGFGAELQLNVLEWLLYLLPALALILLQTGAEELLFRGYLVPALAARFKSPVIWMGVPAVLFGVLHADPDLGGLNSLLMIAAATLFGLVAADLVRLRGNLGAAWGYHFINNVLAFLVVSLPGILSGLGLFRMKPEVAEGQMLTILLVLDICTVGVCWFVLRRRLS